MSYFLALKTLILRIAAPRLFNIVREVAYFLISVFAGTENLAGNSVKKEKKRSKDLHNSLFGSKSTRAPCYLACSARAC